MDGKVSELPWGRRGGALTELSVLSRSSRYEGRLFGVLPGPAFPRGRQPERLGFSLLAVHRDRNRGHTAEQGRARLK